MCFGLRGRLYILTLYVSTIYSIHDTQVLRPDLKRGPWTPEEDARLRELVAEQDRLSNSNTRWASIGAAMNRLGKQARERWINALDPSIRREAWTAEEDRIVLEAYRAMGSRWKEIARLLNGRTENMIKNRWNSSVFREARNQLQQQAQQPPAGATGAAIVAAVPVAKAKAKATKGAKEGAGAVQGETVVVTGITAKAAAAGAGAAISRDASTNTASQVMADVAAADFTKSNDGEPFTEALLAATDTASPWSPRAVHTTLASASFSSFATDSAATSLSASTGSLFLESSCQATQRPSGAGECDSIATEPFQLHMPPAQPSPQHLPLSSDHDLSQWHADLPSMAAAVDALGDPAATFLLI